MKESTWPNEPKDRFNIALAHKFFFFYLLSKIKGSLIDPSETRRSLKSQSTIHLKVAALRHFPKHMACAAMDLEAAAIVSPLVTRYTYRRTRTRRRKELASYWSSPPPPAAGAG